MARSKRRARLRTVEQPKESVERWDTMIMQGTSVGGNLAVLVVIPVYVQGHYEGSEWVVEKTLDLGQPTLRTWPVEESPT